jgi:hypothetical protein
MTEVLLFPQPAEHAAHHHRCCQLQRLQSGNGCSSLPSQHKADCCVEQGQIVGDSLIGSSLLSCATLVPPPPLVCRPLCFANSLSRRLHLLSRYCTPLVQLIVLLPGGLPPPLSRRLCLSSCLPICWLLHRVASRCLVHWPSPPLSS